MAIPSREQFAAFVELADLRPSLVVGAKISEVPPSEEGALAYFDACWDMNRDLVSRVLKSEVWKWLRGQPGFVRGIRAATRGDSRDPVELQSKSEYSGGLARIAKECIQRDIEAGRVYGRSVQGFLWTSSQRTFHTFLAARGKNFRPLRLYADIGRAFQRYFYDLGDDPFGEISQSAVAQAAIDAVIVRMESDVRPVCVVDPYNASARDRYVSILSKLRSLSKDIEDERQNYLPNTRKDETAAERVLIWDLRSAFRSEYKADKATAIFYLCGIENVRHPPDQRRIARMLAEWRGL